MSSKRQKIEAEIMRHRNESNWMKGEESIKLLSKKYGATDGAVVMLQAEVKLEMYLLEFPPRQQNVAKARKDLSNIKTKLQESAASECKESLFNIKEESRALLCKLLYAQGNARPCLEMMKNMDLDEKTVDLPCYKLKMLAEIHATKGLCLERINLKSHESQADSKTIIDCYDRATNLSFSYIKEYERVHFGPQSSNSEPNMGFAMELAFQRGPLLCMKDGDLKNGVERLRSVLQSRLPSSIQQTLTRDLASILLRGMCEATYTPPTLSEEEGSPSKLVTKRGNSSPTATFTISPVEKPFFPIDPTQESILLLIISEAVFNTNPILDMSPEYAEAREELLKDSRSLYDLLAIALADLSQYDVFRKCIEGSLKYAFNEFHIWFQYGLSLVSVGAHDRAIRVLIECSRIQPDNPAPYLLAAKICYESLNNIVDGLDFAKRALDACTLASNDDEFIDDYLCTAHLAVGVGHSCQCVDGSPIEKVKDERSKAILHFSEAHVVDPMNVKPLLFLAVEMAFERRIKEATVHIKEALELQPQDLNCLHLFTLLLTAQKQYKEAFAVLEMATKYYPENIHLQVTKCRLQLLVGKYNDALRTCNYMAGIFKTLHEAFLNHTVSTEVMLDRMTSDGLSVANQSLGNDLEFDGGSYIGSFAVSRIERALSDIESSWGDLLPKNMNSAAANPSALHAHIWLLTSEVYLSLKRYEEAGKCIQEASILFPISYAVLFSTGRLAQCKGDLNDASTLFENAITVNPKYHKALLEWAKILIEQQKYEFAKKLLHDAAKLSPMSHEVWLCLGDVLQELGDIEGAVDCMTTSINLEATSPVIPFSSVAREL